MTIILALIYIVSLALSAYFVTKDFIQIGEATLGDVTMSILFGLCPILNSLLAIYGMSECGIFDKKVWVRK